MKVYQILIYCLIAVLSGCIGNIDLNNSNKVSNTDFEVEAVFSFTVAAANKSRFTLDAINGEVEIVGAANLDSILVTGIRKVGSDSEADAQEYLDKLEVKISEFGSELMVETEQPNNSEGRNYVVNYKITVPSELVLNADNVNGNVTISGIDTTITTENVNGNVKVIDISGSVSVDLINGNIDVETIMPKSGHIDATSVNGNISIRIPTTTSAQVTVDVTNGSISTNNLQFQDEVRTLRSLRGKLLDGDGDIDLDTVNGAITLSGF